MRYLLSLALMVCSLPAAAAEWRSSTFAAGIELPDGVQIATLREPIAADGFTDFAFSLIDSQAGRWSIDGQAVTPSWANFWAANGDRRLVVRLVLTCGGTRAAGIRIARPTTTTVDEDALIAAFDAQTRTAC